ncbi:phage tail protein [Acidovorax sp. GBBC 3332]|nr:MULTISPECIES: phage tail protein [unclassified Acidovorax]MDA8449848.1 phage tail protein [Acidovorax sp. GBBC 3297]MDA8459293.1 phage tail protein [Acidovorax sp. GBBC 3333]MDA8464330.1 phage tail protein [Acidovorax sp. GBBC 3332]MDA8469459.1 phage tail protein [Acidovorax sp. GBBC 3299]
MAEALIQPSLAQDANLVALARLPERITRLDVRPLLVYDLARVDSAALPYLAEQFGIVGPMWQYLQGEAAQRAAILGAVAWHRAKGTPWSITEALSWIGVVGAPDDTRGTALRWATYELVLQQVPADDQAAAIVGLARFAAPARAHLVRLYNASHDIRPIVLDRGPPLDWGMLDNWSGQMGPGGVIQSFGERRGGTVPVAPVGAPIGGRTDVRASVSRYDDMPVLDAWRLDSRVLSGVSGGLMELSIGTCDVSPVGGGTLLQQDDAASSVPWDAPAPEGGRTDTAAGAAPVPVHPPRRWVGPWDGPWRPHFTSLSTEET